MTPDVEHEHTDISPRARHAMRHEDELAALLKAARTFTAEDIEGAAQAMLDEKSWRTDLTFDEYEDLARAALGAVGTVNA